MASISIRMRKTSNVAGRVAHDFRNRTPRYADPERKEFNDTLLGHPIEQDALRQELERAHREKEGKARRKDSALIWEGIITFSTDADLTNREAFDQAALDLLQKIVEQHGFNEPLWLIRHEDESRPHYHFAFANAHAKTAKPVRLSPTDMRQLQDLAGQCFEHLGITRGKTKKQRIEDGEPVHKWINLSVKQLHNDLPAEIESLKQQIEQLNQQIVETTERAEKATRNLERTKQKLQEAGEENEKLQERAETYQKRLEKANKELEQAQEKLASAQSELERLNTLAAEKKRTIKENQKTIEAQDKEIERLKRLKRLVEPHKPKPIQIEQVKGWEEIGWGPFKRKEPILEPAKVIDSKDAEKALIATRKAAEEEARRKAEQAVQNELNRLRQRIHELLQNNQELKEQLEQSHRYRNMLLETIHQASQQQWLSSAQPEHTYRNDEQNPPQIVRYKATLLDYNTKLIAIGDGTPIQQAAALYKESKEKSWEKTIFSGLNEDQISWLVKAAMKDDYDIDFEEDWAKDHAEKVHQKLKQKQQKANWSRGFNL